MLSAQCHTNYLDFETISEHSLVGCVECVWGQDAMMPFSPGLALRYLWVWLLRGLGTDGSVPVGTADHTAVAPALNSTNPKHNYNYCCNLINCSNGSRSARVDLKFSYILSTSLPTTKSYRDSPELSLVANAILNAISFFLSMMSFFSVKCYTSCLISFYF